MKKKLIWMAVPLLSIGALAGCTNNDDRIELTIGFWPQAQEKKDIAMYTKWAEDFEKDNPEYKIVGSPYEYSTDTYLTKFEMGTLPDVFQTWFTEPLKLRNQKVIRDVTEELEKFDWLDRMDDEMRSTLTFDGKIYGVPRDGYGLGLLLNKKILGDNGLLPTVNGEYSIFDENGDPVYPTTFAEIKEWGLAVLEGSINTKAIFLTSSNKQGGWQFSNIAWNYGATLQVKEADGTWKANLNDPAAVRALEWIRDMKSEELLVETIANVYDDWPSKIGEAVAMAFVGSDVLQNAYLKADVPMDDLAFVPMPTGDGVHHDSLYGGTPYVFNKNASDEVVEGILKFFEYIGRSPDTSEINLAAMEYGYEVAKSKNQPIIPKIMPWKDTAYLTAAKEMEDRYVTINEKDYDPFFDTIQDNKRTEEPNCTQDMYEYLDSAIQEVLRNPDTASPENLLTSANAKFQALLDKEINK